MVAWAALQLSLGAEEFRAAVAKVDITPSTPQMLRGYAPRMSTGVRDRIYHRIVALDDGTTSFYLIASDLCSISPAFCDQVTSNLAQELGIPATNVWWSITHNHSSPYVGPPGVPGLFHGNRFQFPLDEEYTALVEKTLVAGAKEARAKLARARLGAGWGYAHANINRRSIISAAGGMNPLGAVDRRIGLLRLEKTGREPLALIANYAMHATVLGGASTVVSGDAPGMVSEFVEQKLGVPMLYINGAAGNMAPLYSVGNDPRFLPQFKTLLAEPILQANDHLRSTKENVVLRTEKIIVETPKKPGLRWSHELRDYLKTSPDGDEMLQVPVRFLQINDDILIWAAPMELFCEISNAVRDRSPYPFTFYFGYTNGTFCYLPTAEEFARGGYEPNTSPFTAAAEEDLKRTVLKQIHTMRMK